MKTWWDNLSSRERALLLLVSGVVLIAVFYLILWEPLVKHVVALRQTVAEERTAAAWMEQVALEVRALRGVATTEKRSGESLLSLVDRSARAAGMGSHINRVEPEGRDKVRVWLNEVAFDVLIPWLAELRKSQAISPESLVADRQSASGVVNVRLVLVGSGG